jgi:hypothetical protein
VQALGGQGFSHVDDPKLSRQSAHSGEVVIFTRRPRFTSQRHFFLSQVQALLSTYEIAAVYEITEIKTYKITLWF